MLEIPLWMLDAIACSTMRYTPDPVADLRALAALKVLLEDDLFEAEPPTGPAPTPNWSTLPAETQRKLIGLMARLFADRAGGRADESRESANDL